MAPQTPIYGQGMAPQTPIYGQGMAPQTPIYGQGMAPQTPIYEQGMNPQTPAYDQGMPPQSLNYDQQMAPQTPAYDQGMPPQIPNYDQQMAPQTPAYDQGMPPQTPNYDQQMAPQTPSYTGGIPPQTPIYEEGLPSQTPMYSDMPPPQTPTYQVPQTPRQYNIPQVPQYNIPSAPQTPRDEFGVPKTPVYPGGNSLEENTRQNMRDNFDEEFDQVAQDFKQTSMDGLKTPAALGGLTPAPAPPANVTQDTRKNVYKSGGEVEQGEPYYDIPCELPTNSKERFPVYWQNPMPRGHLDHLEKLEDYYPLLPEDTAQIKKDWQALDGSSADQHIMAIFTEANEAWSTFQDIYKNDFKLIRRCVGGHLYEKRKGERCYAFVGEAVECERTVEQYKAFFENFTAEIPILKQNWDHQRHRQHRNLCYEKIDSFEGKKVYLQTLEPDNCDVAEMGYTVLIQYLEEDESGGFIFSQSTRGTSSFIEKHKELIASKTKKEKAKGEAFWLGELEFVVRVRPTQNGTNLQFFMRSEGGMEGRPTFALRNLHKEDEFHYPECINNEWIDSVGIPPYLLEMLPDYMQWKDESAEREALAKQWVVHQAKEQQKAKDWEARVDHWRDNMTEEDKAERKRYEELGKKEEEEAKKEAEEWEAGNTTPLQRDPDDGEGSQQQQQQQQQEGSGVPEDPENRRSYTKRLREVIETPDMFSAPPRKRDPDEPASLSRYQNAQASIQQQYKDKYEQSAQYMNMQNIDRQNGLVSGQMGNTDFVDPSFAREIIEQELFSEAEKAWEAKLGFKRIKEMKKRGLVAFENKGAHDSTVLVESTYEGLRVQDLDKFYDRIHEYLPAINKIGRQQNPVARRDRFGDVTDDWLNCQHLGRANTRNISYHGMEAQSGEKRKEIIMQYLKEGPGNGELTFGYSTRKVADISAQNDGRNAQLKDGKPMGNLDMVVNLRPSRDRKVSARYFFKADILLPADPVLMPSYADEKLNDAWLQKTGIPIIFLHEHVEAYIRVCLLGEIIQRPTFNTMKFVKQLKAHYEEVTSKTHLRELLNDEERNEKLRLEFDSNGRKVWFDFTHTHIDVEGLRLLNQMSTDLEISKKIQHMFSGLLINRTEKRRVWHVKLRAQKEEDVFDEWVLEVQDRIKGFSERVRSGLHVGSSGKKLRNFVCIGIGGSYLGPEFVYEALRFEEYAKRASSNYRLRFLANVDPIDLARAMDGLDLEETLFIIVSKTFTTAETMLNARAVKRLLLAHYHKLYPGRDDREFTGAHMCAVSTNETGTKEFGIDREQVFGFWDWVGGRYSVSSAVGLVPLSLFFGFDIMKQFLKGANSVDEQLITDVKADVPPTQAGSGTFMLGLLGFYNTYICGLTSRAVLPYCQALHRFPAHVQQLDMESNGKGVSIDGKRFDEGIQAGPIVFGEPGTNGQHSFYQLMHQGRACASEFIGFTQSQVPTDHKDEKVSNHDELMSNFFAQPDALALGKTREQLEKEKVPEELIEHKLFLGNRPSLSILFQGTLDATKVGQLLAFYEHRVAVEGFIYNVNSFDQWGVELGKVLAKDVRQVFATRKKGRTLFLSKFNLATKDLLSKYLQNSVLKPCQLQRGSGMEKELAQTATAQEKTVFDKIVSREIKADILFEDDLCMAFKDAYPVAEIHFLVIPKAKDGLTGISAAEQRHANLIGHMMFVGSKVAKQLGMDKQGYRTVINDGKHGCQSIYHLHVHFIGGRQLSWPPGI